MRRQWIEKERLIFPLAQLPMEMVRKEENSRGYPFFKNKLMWLGFAIPFVISCINGLHHYFHPLPAITLSWSVSTFRNTQYLPLRISFPIIGFLYLVNTGIAFSLWFFYLFYHILGGWFNIIGISSTESLGLFGAGEPIINHISTGAIVSFAFYGLWLARAHLKEVFKKAFSQKSTYDDSGELLSYRGAVIAIISGTILMIIWLTISGLPLFMSFLFVMLALTIYLAITRVVIESGIPTIRSPGLATPQLISSFGSSAFGPSGLTSLAFTNIYAVDIRTFVMSAASNSVKIAEEIKGKRRQIFWIMLSAVIVSICTSLLVDIHLAYTYGGINLEDYYFNDAPNWAFDFSKERIVHPTEPNKLGWVCKILGGTVLASLMFLRERFLWWPLHPIGLVTGSTWLMAMTWFSIFIGWVLKSVILRYGGPKVYRKSKPFFLGLVLGQYVVAVLWFVIDLITHTTGNVIFWI